MLKRVVLAAAAVGVVGIAGAALADAPTKVRQDMMKTVGFSTKNSAAMVKGEAEYDPLKAELAMRAINAAVTAFPHLFPEGSTTGDETEASPKIWEDRSGFDKEAATLQAASAKAAATAKGGLDAFKAEFAAMTKSCKSCHKSYRIKKK